MAVLSLPHKYVIMIQVNDPTEAFQLPSTFSSIIQFVEKLKNSWIQDKFCRDTKL